MPTEAIVIIYLVIIGKLKDKSIELNCAPPKVNGNQPNKKIIKEFVAQECAPSKIVKNQ